MRARAGVSRRNSTSKCNCRRATAGNCWHARMLAVSNLSQKGVAPQITCARCIVIHLLRSSHAATSGAHETTAPKRLAIVPTVNWVYRPTNCAPLNQHSGACNKAEWEAGGVCARTQCICYRGFRSGCIVSELPPSVKNATQLRALFE